MESPFDNWYNTNRKALEYLYYLLNDICYKHDITINDNQNTINDFIYMMYNESNGAKINPDLHPSFY